MRLVSKLSARKSFAVNLLGTEPEEWGDGGFFYPSMTGWSGGEISDSFDSYVEHAYKANGIVFACIQARLMPFSEARFQYQELVDGNPGRLTTGPGLGLLESPWPTGTTGELLARMEQDASLAGNFYATPIADRVRRMNPGWVAVVSGVRDQPTRSKHALESEVLGYIYHAPGEAPVFLTPGKVVHYSPIPDPSSPWRGMSWLTPVLGEVRADTQMTTHKLKFLKQGASLNFAIRYDKELTAEQVREYAAIFAEKHEGVANAYKALHIGGGADPVTIGTNMKDLDFKAVQGAGETRVAAAAGVGAIIARFSEGLQGSSLNAGNYEAAKRQFADMTLRPLWRSAAGSLTKLTTPPANHRLWYDTRDIEFLKADRKDAAEIQQLQAATISTLVTAGFTPASVTLAVESGDFARLDHSGMYSIQLQPAGALAGSDAKAVRDALVKVGARNSASDLELIQAAHDAVAALGATCVSPEEATE